MTAISPDAEPATRGELERLRVELHAEIERLRLEVQADIATLRADLERAMHAQTRWIIGAFGAIAAITVAILRLT
ncbi:MAG: hypothetical protein OXG38_00125 [Chloroflexi bacterium]|nr:hypothetical protein [Chloroflexota bacterium]